ncbi:phage integrase central domain-containing protein [Methylocaldum marinum]|uniref:phage integrase central domain-containing protein n=1 Tax=Methylocaldum marinum TaxID=1432792 RepID=UPI0022B259D9|nr:hypothetical protein [Methylocaldum marinum]
MKPAHHRKAQELNTFRTIAEEYLTDQAEVWTPRTLKQRRALLEAKIYPTLGDRPINDISSADILRILLGIQATAPTVAAIDPASGRNPTVYRAIDAAHRPGIPNRDDSSKSASAGLLLRMWANSGTKSFPAWRTGHVLHLGT